MSAVLVLVTAAATWLVTGGWSSFMPPVQAVLPQNLSFREREGYAHNGTAVNEYIYNALRFFWS